MNPHNLLHFFGIEHEHGLSVENEATTEPLRQEIAGTLANFAHRPLTSPTTKARISEKDIVLVQECAPATKSPKCKKTCCDTNYSSQF